MKIGFIGVGNMATAIIEGGLRGGLSNFLLFEHAEKKGKVTAFAQAKGLEFSTGYEAFCGESDIVMLCVKPQVLGGLLPEIAPHMDGKAAVSIAAGWSTARLREALPKTRILRTMPNTPLQVNSGYTVFSQEHDLSKEELQAVEGLFDGSGEVGYFPERLFDAAGTLTGCTPAYLSMFMEALADAGVRAGIPRGQALHMAANVLRGTGEMALVTGRHPAELKDAVCSPGGSTIEGVAALEEGGFRAAVIAAIGAAIDKTRNMA